jgi:hypothetical protein
MSVNDHKFDRCPAEWVTDFGRLVGHGYWTVGMPEDEVTAWPLALGNEVVVKAVLRGGGEMP